MIPNSTAHLLATLFVICYVGSIYISKHARLSFSNTKVYLNYGFARPKLLSERWRDDPDVIRARLFAVSIATLVNCGILFTLMSKQLGNASWAALYMTINYLGFTAISVLPHLITPLLFLGPLYALSTRDMLPGQRHWSFQEDVLSLLFSITGIRNYLVGPVTEEIVFRGCVLTVYHLAQAPRMRMIFLSPLLFGVAHVHHAWETYNRYGRTPAAMKRAAVGTAFQFIYTSVFGFYCSYLFLRTGSIFPPVTAHIFCNIMGVPQPDYDVTQRPNRKLVIIIAYLMGIVGFVYLLDGWTFTEGSLYWN